MELKARIISEAVFKLSREKGVPWHEIITKKISITGYYSTGFEFAVKLGTKQGISKNVFGSYSLEMDTLSFTGIENV